MQDNSISSDLVYLRPEVKLEPLVCRWYAWSHLMSPAQLALHIANRFLPLLKSFVANPDEHLAAGADPNLYGGPFVSLTARDLPAVQKLSRITASQCRNLIELADDLKTLLVALQEKASGHSLHEFYGALPDSLKGLVEFLYDTNHHASIRLFEDLLLDEHPMEEFHELMLHRVGERDRDFFMSTPRVDGPDKLFLELGFSDARIDVLAATRVKPASLAHMAELLEIPKDQIELFQSFFTAHAPAPRADKGFEGEDVRVRFFGHACVLFQTRQVSVLFDPFVAIEPGTDGRLTINDLPDFIDYVVLTHSHHDHFSIEMLLQLRHRVGRVVVPASNRGGLADPSMKLALQQLGFSQIQVLDQFEHLDIPGGKILSLPFTGEHSDLNIHSKQAIALTLQSHTSLFLVDSDGRDAVLYQRMMRRIGPVDLLFIGMECQGAPLNWLYEPLLTTAVSHCDNESRRLSGSDCERAWAIINEVNPTQVFVYAMGQDPWMKYVMGLEYQSDSIQLIESDKLIERCIAADIHAERLVSGREFCVSESRAP